jgi:hypothetical protein
LTDLLNEFLASVINWGGKFVYFLQGYVSSVARQEGNSIFAPNLIFLVSWMGVARIAIVSVSSFLRSPRRPVRGKRRFLSGTIRIATRWWEKFSRSKNPWIRKLSLRKRVSIFQKIRRRLWSMWRMGKSPKRPDYFFDHSQSREK